MATNFNNQPDYYGVQLAAGQEYQDYVAWRLLFEGIPLVNFQSKQAQLARGENAFGLEIKFDDQFEKTGNLWIETAEKSEASHPEWIPSGIDRGDARWYGIGNYVEFFLFSIKYLQANRRINRENNRKTSLGFLLPRKDAAALADGVFAWPSGRAEFLR